MVAPDVGETTGEIEDAAHAYAGGVVATKPGGWIQYNLQHVGQACSSAWTTRVRGDTYRVEEG